MSNKLLHFSVLLIMLPAVYTGFFPGKIVLIKLLCMVLYLILIWSLRKNINFTNFDGKYVILFYIAYSIIEYIRGIFFNIEGLRDYIYIYSGLFHLIFFSCWILLSRPKYIMIFWKSFMTLGVIMSICLAIFPPSHAMHTMAHNMLWLNAFIFMYPYIKRKYFIVILAMAFFIVTFDLNRRSIMLGYIIPTVILVTYLSFRKYILHKAFFYIAVLIPLICLMLFYTKTFNVFQYLEESNKELVLQKSTRSVFVDSRTGIYEDVTRDVFRAKEWWKPYIGLGGNGKVGVDANGASTFGFEGLRSRQESAMLTYIQHGGLLGLTAYGLLIITAAYLAIFKSRNDFMRMLGLFLVYKFAYSFIEDELDFSGHVIAQFLWIGMAYNKSFRNMSDKRMKSFIRRGLNIFPIFKTLTGKRIIRIKKIRNERYKQNFSA